MMDSSISIFVALTFHPNYGTSAHTRENDRVNTNASKSRRAPPARGTMASAPGPEFRAASPHDVEPDAPAPDMPGEHCAAPNEYPPVSRARQPIMRGAPRRCSATLPARRHLASIATWNRAATSCRPERPSAVPAKVVPGETAAVGSLFHARSLVTPCHH